MTYLVFVENASIVTGRARRLSVDISFEVPSPLGVLSIYARLVVRGLASVTSSSSMRGSPLIVVS